MEKQPSRARFRFYAELNDHLPRELQFKTLEKSFFAPSTVKDMVESFGVPHTEIDLIVANGRPVDFAYRVQNGDRIAIYPTFESFDIASEQRLRGVPLRNPKFVLDVHLGKLAAYLRMLGFDAEYGRSHSDARLAQISAAEHRILLTRDRDLLKRGCVTHGYWVRESDSRRQLAEVTERLQLGRAMRPFTRCMACNGVLKPVTKQEAEDLVPRRAFERYNDFERCERCGRVYWKGSHYDRMLAWLKQLATEPQRAEAKRG